MTDRARNPQTARPRRRKPSAYPVAVGSAAAFMGLTGFLAYQLRTGHDPALGNKVAIQQVVAPKRVLLKRIENKIIVTKVIPASESGDDGGGTPVQVASVPVQGSSPVVVQSAPAVVQSAPAPAPAAAPVVTRTS